MTEKNKVSPVAPARSGELNEDGGTDDAYTFNLDLNSHSLT